MSLTIITGQPGGPQKAALIDRITPGTLWIAIDQDPPDVPLYGVLRNQPYSALAGMAARLGRPLARTPQEMIVSTIEGFHRPAQRPAREDDFTPETLAIAKAVLHQDPLPDQIIIASLSALYERMVAAVLASASPEWTVKLAEHIVAFAGSAMTHFLVDLLRSEIPIVASAWDITTGRKASPYLPRGAVHVADAVIREEEAHALEAA